MKYSPKFLISMAVAALFMVGAACPVVAQSSGGKKSIRVLILEEFPPQFVSTPEGPSGLAVEVMREVARRVSLDIEFVTVKSWPEVYTPLKNGSVDVLANMGISETRRKIVEFTDPYEVFGIKLFVRAETIDIEKFDDLNARLLGLLATNVLTKGLVQSGKYNTKIYTSFQAMLLALLSGEIDAMPAPTEPFLLIARAAHLDSRIQAVGPSLLEVKRAIAVPKGQTELRDLLNKGLTEFKQTKDYPALLSKWYGKPTPYWGPVKIGILMGGMLLASILLMGWWRYYSVVRLSRRVQKSEKRFRDFAKASSDWLWETDENHRFIFISDDDDVHSSTGLVKKNILGKKRTDFVNEEMERDPTKWARHVADLDAHRPIEDFQYSIVTPKGGVREFSVWGTPIFGSDGMFNGYRGVARDITKRKQNQSLLAQSSKLATLGEMATGIAHEINQPLNIIRMTSDTVTEMLEQGDEPSYDFLKIRLERISSQVKRAASIIDRMRIFGRTPLEHTTEVSPRDAVLGAVSHLREQFRLDEIQLELDVPETCRLVMGDRIQLEQVVLNLLNNAHDAIMDKTERTTKDKSTDRVSVIVEDDLTTRVFKLIIEDTGGGIPEDFLPKIFDPFFTSKEIGKGTGLGLSISYGIIKDIGGSIESANVDGGARFTISLPVAEEALE